MAQLNSMYSSQVIYFTAFAAHRDRSHWNLQLAISNVCELFVVCKSFIVSTLNSGICTVNYCHSGCVRAWCTGQQLIATTRSSLSSVLFIHTCTNENLWIENECKTKLLNVNLRIKKMKWILLLLKYYGLPDMLNIPVLSNWKNQ